jgi:fluoroquinolone transport system permease protein
MVSVLPKEWMHKIVSILIYSDPAAMGLFFMGAILLLEKSQRVISSIAISPVKSSEYILSKVISLGITGTVVGTLIALFSGAGNLFGIIIGTFLGSVIFSLLGLLVASRITSLNQFLVASLPFELISFAPPIIYMFGYRKPYMLLHPGCILIHLMSYGASHMAGYILYLLFWIGIIYLITIQQVKFMFRCIGGVTL